MSGLSPEAGPPPSPSPAAGQPDDRTLAVRDGLTSLSIVLAWFVTAALIGAVVWWQVTPLAEFTRTASNATMDEEQLAKQFSTDGWFITIAAAGGLLSGLLLVLLRRRNPVLMVLFLAVGGALATWVMLQVGLALGPSDPSSVLAATPVGGKVPLQLEPEANGVWFVWPITALVGAILALWITDAREEAAQPTSFAPPPSPWSANQG